MASTTRSGAISYQCSRRIQSVNGSRSKTVSQQRWQHNSTASRQTGQTAIDEIDTDSLRRKPEDIQPSSSMRFRKDAPAFESSPGVEKSQSNKKGVQPRFSGLVPYSTEDGSSNFRPTIAEAPSPIEPHSAPKTVHSQPARLSFLQQKARSVLERLLAARRQASQDDAAESVLWKVLNSNGAHLAHDRQKINHLDTDYKNLLALFTGISKSNQATHETTVASISQTREPQSSPDKVPKNIFSLAGYGASDNAQKPIDEDSVTEEHPAAPEQSPAAADMIYDTASHVLQDISTAFEEALYHANLSPEQAMWNVCEERIFPLIRLLTSARPNLASAPSLSSSSTNPQPGPHPLIPSPVPLVPLLSIVYPAALLLALRMYICHYPHSPYPISLLPNIKSLGPTSYVLGANTYFYNTLLTLRWDVYSDLQGISTLLAEMQSMGLELDIDTRRLLKRIAKERRMDLAGSEYLHDKEAASSSEDKDLDDPEPEDTPLDDAAAASPEDKARGEVTNSIGLNRERGKTWWLRPLIDRQFTVIREWKNVLSKQTRPPRVGREREVDVIEQRFSEEEKFPRKGKFTKEEELEIEDLYSFIYGDFDELVQKADDAAGTKGP